MRNENQFNAKLGVNLRGLQPEIRYIKTSDKFTVGIADFLIWFKSAGIALENKFVKEWPNNNARLLQKHQFTGPQLTFLESIQLTNNPAWGGIYVDCEKTFYLVPSNQIPPLGNWKTGVFRQEVSDGVFKGFDKDDTTGMVLHMRGSYGT